jgi:hypothetical protein
MECRWNYWSVGWRQICRLLCRPLERISPLIQYLMSPANPPAEHEKNERQKDRRLNSTKTSFRPITNFLLSLPGLFAFTPHSMPFKCVRHNTKFCMWNRRRVVEWNEVLKTGKAKIQIRETENQNKSQPGLEKRWKPYKL